MMGEQLKEKEFTEYLGILIDSRETLRMLFFTFIQPYIDYGLLICGGATASNLKPIQRKLKEQ